ncbi:MAG: hypothetical protein JWM25_860 [Thermoleophilia bacterium]|nr:hypothetical protein [Thermoleophilia bacterium]MCZ4496277.1 hypothetical protein [Thermoleophilia bacterium]
MSFMCSTHPVGSMCPVRIELEDYARPAMDIVEQRHPWTEGFT